MDLGGWNQRLAAHFDALARERKDIPLFALEHGLAPAEVLALSDGLRAHILVSPPSPKHSLVWVVYAAEIGYGYAGDEYWQTFEAKTPGWTSNGTRGWIRDVFLAFQKEFSGAKPSGPWAEQFSIIAWPITHAILPRDLQQQLARILYDLRHAFSAELFDEPQRLGDFIAARSWNTSARFRNLVQAPALVGQMAAALLLQGREGFETLLHPMTLKRIGDDVDRERRGRDWLRGARRAAEERARVRGLTIGRPTTATFQHRDEARAEVERLGIEPRLVLRPIEDSRWEVSLEIPDLSHLLLRFPQMCGVLTESRCTVAGAAGRPLARGRCLHGPQRVALSHWPRPDEVLLKFDRAEPQLEYLLRTECLLRPGALWLFRVAADGLAYESRGMRVRGGSKYLLVSTAPFVRPRVACHVEIACQGVNALLLDVPPALTLEWEQALRQLQVTQAKSIEVWPAGLAALAWDGEGHGEWLASERPALAIRADHAIDELTIAMGDGPSLSLTLTDTPLGEPVFIGLPPLPVGLHKFSVGARGGNGADSEVIGDLDVVMRIREARPWSPGAITHGLIEVELDPAAPSLEQLWEAKVAVAVRGAASRQVRCRVQMFRRATEAPSFTRQLPPLTLPLSSEEWTRHFDSHLKNDRGAQRAYDDAQACEIEFSADELGVFKLRCEREFRPLRWSLRRDAAGFAARLHDDAGSGLPVIERYSFERPAIGHVLSPVAEHKAPLAGGLYVGTLGDFRASIVVPPIVRGFSELKCEPRVDIPDRTNESIVWLLSLARLWGDARLSGDVIGGERQRLVVRTLTAHIWSLLGGYDWSRMERAFSHGDVGIRDLRTAVLRSQPRGQTCVGREALPAEQIFPHDVLDKLANAPLHERGAAFTRLATKLQVPPARESQRGRAVRSRAPRPIVVRRAQSSAWLAEFALRIASDPVAVEGWAGEHVAEGVNRLRELPTLARAARFLVLAVEQRRKSRAATGELYAGWKWPS